jgi:hypothetical protein
MVQWPCAQATVLVLPFDSHRDPHKVPEERENNLLNLGLNLWQQKLT